MKVSTQSFWRACGAALAIAGMYATLGARPILAQDEAPDPGLPAPAGAEAPAPADPNAPASPTDGPVRLARISDISGNVTWRPDETAPWADATMNLPLRQGAQIWVSGPGRGEIQFDDGSQLRLDHDVLLTLSTLYSDADGEFTDIKLNAGRVGLRLKHEKSIFQVSTPFAVARGNGPANDGAGSFADVSKFSVAVGDTVNIVVDHGHANVEGDGGKTSLNAGDALLLTSSTAPYEPHAAGVPDAWENWNHGRDLNMEAAERGPSHDYLPPNQELVAGNLDHYGVWRDEGHYGHVWYPRYADSSWRPYRDGHWTWVSPFGWTWVSDEPWGWAPYHYGTWIRGRHGWAWVPGPVNQYWCPAVVSFSSYRGDICWTPLCPEDIIYPSFLSLGYHNARWSFFFSIGGAGFYYANERGFCEGRPWNSRYINRFRYNPHFIERVTVINRGAFTGRNSFVPRNARFGGASLVAEGNFGRRGAFRQGGADASVFYRQGRVVGVREAGGAGPVLVRPTLASQSATGSFRTNVAPPRRALERTVLRTQDRPSAVIAAAGAFRGAATHNVTGRSSTGGNRPGQAFHESPVATGAVGTGRGNTVQQNEVRGNAAHPETVHQNTGRGGGASSVERARAGLGLPGHAVTTPATETHIGPTGVLTPRQPATESIQGNRSPNYSSPGEIERARANLGLPSHTVNGSASPGRSTGNLPVQNTYERPATGTGRGNFERSDNHNISGEPSGSVPGSVARARSSMGFPAQGGNSTTYREPGATHGYSNSPSYSQPQPSYRQPQPTYSQPQPSYGGRGNSGYSGGSPVYNSGSGGRQSLPVYSGRGAPSNAGSAPVHREPAASTGTGRGSGGSQSGGQASGNSDRNSNGNSGGHSSGGGTGRGGGGDRRRW